MSGGCLCCCSYGSKEQQIANAYILRGICMKNEIKKLERDGKIAVLVSPGYGAGWSTWSSGKTAELLTFDADIVQAVLDGDKVKAAKIAEEKVDGYVCVLGADDLVVEWVDKGEQFEIRNYDGAESLHIISRSNYFTA
jgi:hypothetical protein